MRAIIAFFCLFTVSFTNVYAQATAEEKAVLAVIEAETKDFVRLPFAEVAQKYWILDKNTFICATDGHGDANFVTAEDMLQNTGIAPEEQTTVEKTKYMIVINGNMASVYHHQIVRFLDSDVVLYSHETRTLEKMEGNWKIHNSTVIHYIPK